MRNSLLLLIVMLASCFPLEKAIKDSYRSELYIDYAYVCFRGSNATQSISFEIDSVSDRKYWGRLILDNRDSVSIHGFEKGGFYPSWYQLPSSGEEMMMEIWCMTDVAQIPEQLEIVDRDTLHGLIRETTILYRQPRFCH